MRKRMTPKKLAPAKAGVADFSDKIMRKSTAWSFRVSSLPGRCYTCAAAAAPSAGFWEPTMANDREKKVRRILQLKFTLPGTEPTRFVAFIKATAPYYELFGGKQIRLLQNVDQPAQFIQIIDYEVHETLESSRHEIARDPRLQGFLQAWGAIFPGTIEVDVFREIDESEE